MFGRSRREAITLRLTWPTISAPVRVNSEVRGASTMQLIWAPRFSNTPPPAWSIADNTCH